MTEQLYIWIVRWQDFQHYKRGRDPIWIKNYLRLLTNDDYLELSFAQRGLLHGLWIAFGESRQRLPQDPRKLRVRFGQKVRKDTLDSLVTAGFIEYVDSTVLAERMALASKNDEFASTEVEVLRTSTKSERESRNSNGSRSHQKKASAAICPECEVGAGLHTADCSHAAADADIFQ